jgi:hypothetical protein
MTRKDYERMLNVFKAAWRECDKSHSAYNAITEVGKQFCAAASIDNARFDSAKFMLLLEQGMN